MVDEVILLFSCCLLMTYKRQKVPKIKSEGEESTTIQNSHYWWNIFFFRGSDLSFLQFIHRRTEFFAIIDQERHKLKQILHLEPHDYQINYVNIDLHH